MQVGSSQVEAEATGAECAAAESWAAAEQERQQQMLYRISVW